MSFWILRFHARVSKTFLNHFFCLQLHSTCSYVTAEIVLQLWDFEHFLVGNNAEVLFLDDKVLIFFEILACTLLFLPGENVTFWLRFHSIMNLKASLFPTSSNTNKEKLFFKLFCRCNYKNVWHIISDKHLLWYTVFVSQLYLSLSSFTK